MRISLRAVVLASLTFPAGVTVGLAVAPSALADSGTCPTPAVGPAVPGKIASAEELQWLRNSPAQWGGTWSQMADINMSPNPSAPCVWTAAIGDGTNPFTGTFDGGGFEISGLSISLTPTDDYAGLFGFVTNSGVIENVGFTGDVSGGSAVGGLVGSLRDSALIRNSYTTGDVTATGGNVGGLVGQVSDAIGGISISESFATGDVSSPTGLRVGGLVGYFATPSLGGSLSNSYATGSVTGGSSVGGLVGSTGGDETEVTNSYSTGQVTGTTNAGGLVGDSTNTPSSGFTASYWNTDTSLPTSAGGSNVRGRTTSQMQDISTFSSWSISASGLSSIWGICSAVNNGYPFLTVFYSSDPCTGVTPVIPGASVPTYTFSFLTSGGGKCLPDVTVTRLQRFTLPPASVACTPLGTSLVGWSIPGQDWAFAPGQVVTVVDSQVFTAVAREPEITITYDANVNMGNTCIANNVNIAEESDRHQSAQTPRFGPTAALATSAPCSPPGFTLIGWTDANTPDGSGKAQQRAQTYKPGATIPEAWNVETPNPVNGIHLYALWGRSVT